MKRTHLVTLAMLLFGATAIAQEITHRFDNFDTQRGVQILASPSAERARIVTQPTAISVSKHYLPSPAVGDDYQRSLAARPAIVENYPLDTKPNAMTTVTDTLGRSFLLPLPKDSTRPLMASRGQLKGFSTGDSLIDGYIIDSCSRYQIDPLLIYAQMGQESSYNLRATSNKGASGLMQLMPATARRLGVTNIYDPKQNIEGGVKYMRLLLDMFDGDVTLALAGYNAGEGAVLKYGYQIPPYNETQDYVRRISARYQAIARPTLGRRLQGDGISQ